MDVLLCYGGDPPVGYRVVVVIRTDYGENERRHTVTDVQRGDKSALLYVAASAFSLLLASITSQVLQLFCFGFRHELPITAPPEYPYNRKSVGETVVEMGNQARIFVHHREGRGDSSSPATARRRQWRFA